MLGKPTHMVAFMAAIGALAACALAPAAAAKPKGTDACAKWGDALPTDLSAEQARKATQCLLNEARRNRGLRPLKRSNAMEAAAQEHTALMVESGCFSHVCPNEVGLDIRLEEAGYLVDGLLAFAYGENIGWGSGRQGTPRAVIESWLSSPPHRANILDRDFRQVGIGFSIGSPVDSDLVGGVYTADFGFRRR